MRMIVVLICHLYNNAHISLLPIDDNGGRNCDRPKFSEFVFVFYLNNFASFQHSGKCCKCLNFTLSMKIVHTGIDLFFTKGDYSKSLTVYLKSGCF